MHRRTIGYCGGIASGKSTRLRHIAQWWESSGKTLYPRVVFKTIDADVVGHKCYEPGSELYHKVVEHFSPFEKTTGSILVEATNKTDQGSSSTFLPEHHHQQQVQHTDLSGVKNLPIDRKKLGAIVFSDKERLKELNQIMWPAIANAVALEISNTERDILERKTQRIGSMTSTGEQCDASNDVLRKSHLVFAVEAAILPQMTEMLNMCDEVWLYHANKETAVRRVMDRNKVSAEEAERRINSQMSVEEYMKLIAEAESKPFMRTFNTSGLESDSDFAFDMKKQINNFEEMLEGLEK